MTVNSLIRPVTNLPSLSVRTLGTLAAAPSRSPRECHGGGRDLAVHRASGLRVRGGYRRSNAKASLDGLHHPKVCNISRSGRAPDKCPPRVYLHCASGPMRSFLTGTDDV